MSIDSQNGSPNKISGALKQQHHIWHTEQYWREAVKILGEESVRFDFLWPFITNQVLSLYCYRHFNLLITQSKHFVFVRERIDHDRKCVQKYKDKNARNFNKTLGLTTTTLNGALYTAFRLVQNLRSDRMKEPMIGLKRSTDATGVEPLKSPAQLICKSIRKNQISTDCRPTNERNDNYAVS